MEAFEMLRAVDLLEMGLPPVGGGSLDQTRAFNEAARFVLSERRWNEVELKTRSRR